MSTPITDDSAVFHYTLTEGTSAFDTVYEIGYEYISSTDDPIRVEPSLSIDQGNTFTLIENKRFTLAKGIKQFSIRLRINNDPTTTKDTKVNLRVWPITNTQFFVNAVGMDTSVEFTNAGGASVMRGGTGDILTVDEGQYGLAHYELIPALESSAVLKVNVGPPTALGTDINHLQYSLDNTNWINIPASGLFEITSGAYEFFLRFMAMEDLFMLENDMVNLTVTDPGSPVKVYGGPITKSFTIIDKTILPVGTFINWYCDGFKKTGRYSDGVGGFTTQVMEEDSTDCGFVIAPYGTVLATYCANYNLYEKVADGQKGFFLRVKTEDVPGVSPGCGYVPFTVNTQTVLTPTVLKAFDLSVVSNDDLGFAASRREGARSEFRTRWGKWYWEVEVSRPTESVKAPAVGIVTSKHSMRDWIGATAHSWAWWGFEGTKYFSDVQSLYPSDTIRNKDIISVLLDTDAHTVSMWLNGKDLGVMYANLPDEEYYAAINAADESYARFNFGQYEFKYTPPTGFFPGFGMVKENPPITQGTLIRTYCDGFNLMNEYADGRYGVYVTLNKENSPTCGYNPIPAQGTVLGYVCQGLDRYKRIADGLGGESQLLYEINSRSCGYVAPPVPAVHSGNLNTDWKTPETTFNVEKTTAQISGSVRSEQSVYSGKWYWEVVVDGPNVVVGIGTQHTDNKPEIIVGSNAYTWGMNLKDKALVHNGTALDVMMPAVQAGDTIGVSLDFVNQRLAFSVNGVWIDGAIFNDLPYANGENYYPMISSLALNPPVLPTATVHFAQSSLTYDEPIGFNPGFGSATTIYSRKGTVQNRSCTGYDRYARVADGGGGTYTILLETNSSICGWKPPDPAGTLKSTFCSGLDLYGKYADGNYGFYDALIDSVSEECGYKPAGALVSTYCNGFNKIGNYSDGLVPQGTYIGLIQENSRECGYDDGSGYVYVPGGNQLDPNLPESHPDGLIINIYPIPDITDGIVIDKEIMIP